MSGYEDSNYVPPYGYGEGYAFQGSDPHDDLPVLDGRDGRNTVGDYRHSEGLNPGLGWRIDEYGSAIPIDPNVIPEEAKYLMSRGGGYIDSEPMLDTFNDEYEELLEGDTEDPEVFWANYYWERYLRDIMQEPIESKESLAVQLQPAYKGYKAVIDDLNSYRHKEGEVAGATAETIVAEFEVWFTDDKLACVVAAQETDPNVRFTLVATPNVAAGPNEVLGAAIAFGEGQPEQAETESSHWSLYESYTAEQLSGTAASNGNAVAFSLIPSSYTPEMTGNFVELRAKLAELQTDNPNLKVPSVLDAVTYWQTLRAQGETLTDGSSVARTDILHFDLPEQTYRLSEPSHREYLDVPCTFVYDSGKPFLDFEISTKTYNARLSLG